jgi:hypothetical protein
VGDAMLNKYHTLWGFLILSFIAACVVFVGFSFWSCVKPQPKVQRSHVAERWVVKRHIHHGIEVSRGDYETGESWFENEKGQKCQL